MAQNSVWQDRFVPDADFIVTKHGFMLGGEPLPVGSPVPKDRFSIRSLRQLYEQRWVYYAAGGPPEVKKGPPVDYDAILANANKLANERRAREHHALKAQTYRGLGITIAPYPGDAPEPSGKPLDNPAPPETTVEETTEESTAGYEDFPPTEEQPTAEQPTDERKEQPKPKQKQKQKPQPEAPTDDYSEEYK